MKKKLFIQHNNGKYEEIDGFLALNSLKEIKKTPISEAINKYIENCTSNKCKKNQNSEKLYFDKLSIFANMHGLKFIDEFSSKYVDQFESILLKKMKVSSVNRRFNTFKNFFAKCLEWELIYKNPCEGKKKRREEKNHRSAWTHDIFKMFIKECSGNHKNIFTFLWLTGCRPMELKNLKWTDIDYDEKNITLRCGKNSNVSRKFPLTKELDKFLHKIKMDSVYVFTENKKQVNNDALYHYCKKRLKPLGLNKYTVYGIRHGFGTKLAKQGISAFYIAQLMGHSKIDTTRQYIQDDKNQLISILSKVS